MYLLAVDESKNTKPALSALFAPLRERPVDFKYHEIESALTAQRALGVIAFGGPAWSNADPGAGPRQHRQGVAACALNQTGQAYISRSLAMHLQEFVVGGTGIAEVLFSRVVRYLAFPS